VVILAELQLTLATTNMLQTNACCEQLGNLYSVKHVWVAWLFGRLKFPLSTKIGYIGDKVLGGDLVLPG